MHTLLMIENNYKYYAQIFGSVINAAYLCPIIHTKKCDKMKKATRNLYMNIQGSYFTEQQAKEYYGCRFETAILAKVVVKKGNVVGTWA